MSLDRSRRSRQDIGRDDEGAVSVVKGLVGQ